MTQPGGEFDLTVTALRELEVKGQVTRTIDPATGTSTYSLGPNVLQLGFALFLSDDTWARVGPLLSGASTLVAAGFGYAWGHYFSGKN